MDRPKAEGTSAAEHRISLGPVPSAVVLAIVVAGWIAVMLWTLILQWDSFTILGRLLALNAGLFSQSRVTRAIA